MLIRKGEDPQRKRLERGIETLKWQRRAHADDAEDRADYDRRIRRAEAQLRELGG